MPLGIATVQSKVVPLNGPVGVTAVVLLFEQIVWGGMEFTVGVGFTTIV